MDSGLAASQRPGMIAESPALLRLLRGLLLLGFFYPDQRLLCGSASAAATATAFQRRDRVVHADRHQQALEHFDVARHAAVRGLADAAPLVSRRIGRPALVELLMEIGRASCRERV